ncbi:hypothetical protein DL95DRAFT_460444 [Leptodontidium sp. 2 PMI_412]|nr:hypothetical protein DL95DRAFT_460444 [Leptodontidium sp. 2 PMI_412]
MARERLRVTLSGATGETGAEIANAILDLSDTFHLTALARPASANKPEYENFKKRGASVIVADLGTVNDHLVSTLKGCDIVVCAVTLEGLDPGPMNNLATAAQHAGVKRFIPSLFGPVCPPRGVVPIRDLKEDMIDHIRNLSLPYTLIDVGWWYQMSLPAVPSGKLDHLLFFPITTITGSGNVECAMTDKRDIGRYVARIIADPQTLNRSVFLYNEIWTQNKLFDLVERLSGETIPRQHETQEDLKLKIDSAKKRSNDGDETALVSFAMMAYNYSLWIRGDNTPAKARDLGYLVANDMYPDIKGTSLEDYVKSLLDGNIGRIYAGRR